MIPLAKTILPFAPAFFILGITQIWGEGAFIVFRALLFSFLSGSSVWAATYIWLNRNKL